MSGNRISHEAISAIQKKLEAIQTKIDGYTPNMGKSEAEEVAKAIVLMLIDKADARIKDKLDSDKPTILQLLTANKSYFEGLINNITEKDVNEKKLKWKTFVEIYKKIVAEKTNIVAIKSDMDNVAADIKQLESMAATSSDKMQLSQLVQLYKVALQNFAALLLIEKNVAEVNKIIQKYNDQVEKFSIKMLPVFIKYIDQKIREEATKQNSIYAGNGNPTLLAHKASSAGTQVAQNQQQRTVVTLSN